MCSRGVRATTNNVVGERYAANVGTLTSVWVSVKRVHFVAVEKEDVIYLLLCLPKNSSVERFVAGSFPPVWKPVSQRSQVVRSWGETFVAIQAECQVWYLEDLAAKRCGFTCSWGIVGSQNLLCYETRTKTSDTVTTVSLYMYIVRVQYNHWSNAKELMQGPFKALWVTALY